MDKLSVVNETHKPSGDLIGFVSDPDYKEYDHDDDMVMNPMHPEVPMPAAGPELIRQSFSKGGGKRKKRSYKRPYQRNNKSRKSKRRTNRRR